MNKLCVSLPIKKNACPVVCSECTQGHTTILCINKENPKEIDPTAPIEAWLLCFTDSQREKEATCASTFPARGGSFA
jgi:hypothetical protein